MSSFENGTYNGFVCELHDPGILVITFNQPERLNGSTQPMKRDLIETLVQAQMHDSVRVVVFTGQGNAFCAGDDLSGGYDKPADSGRVESIPGGHHNPIGTYNGLRVISQAVNVAIRNLDKLTIAAINGFAIQTGFSMALACDFRIADKDAKMGSATLRFGLLPDEGGQYLLVQHLGVAKTIDFLMRKRIITGAQAYELGLVHQAVDGTKLMETTMELAQELAAGPQVAMRMLKRSIYNAYEMTWDQSLDEIASKTAIVDHHLDAKEGASSFLAKRQPKFNQWLDQ